eukprot:1362852-Pleurochrysis_carterae.AAC.1
MCARASTTRLLEPKVDLVGLEHLVEHAEEAAAHLCMQRPAARFELRVYQRRPVRPAALRVAQRQRHLERADARPESSAVAALGVGRHQPRGTRVHAKRGVNGTVRRGRRRPFRRRRSPRRRGRRMLLLVRDDAQLAVATQRRKYVLQLREVVDVLLRRAAQRAGARGAQRSAVLRVHHYLVLRLRKELLLFLLLVVERRQALLLRKLLQQR